MFQKTVEHILGIIIVSIVLIGILAVINRSNRQAKQAQLEHITKFIDCEFIDFNDPFHKALLTDVMNIYYPGHYDENKQRAADIMRYKEDKFSRSLQRAHVKESLNAKRMVELLGMYLKFFLVYVLVMILTYYGVQSFGVWRFIKKKQHAELQSDRNFRALLLLPFRKIAKNIIYFILFSPAYVIAYSIRTEFNTETVFFMVLLGVVSNGLLVMYTNKFYTFLVAESRKGYVETARVKNLKTSYVTHSPEGISLSAVFRPIKRFDGHIFGHIFKNAHHQYFATIKEQASFLITGLIIIEMALNIHGHLSYEMLRQILYKNYDIVIVIILGIFYTVKLTEIVTDFIINRETVKYENS